MPSASEIHVWRALLPDHSAQLEDIVSAAELRYAAGMTSDTARRQFLGAQAALRLVLGKYLQREPAGIRFRRGEHGKPFLEHEHGAQLQFNLTHSHDLAVAAVTLEHEIGVDLEKVRSRPSAQRLANRFFADSEKAALAAGGEARLERTFFRLWTRKEAHIKATGTGLSVNLRAIDTLAPDPNWWYHEFAASEDYVASVAGTGPLPGFRYHQLSLPT